MRAIHTFTVPVKPLSVNEAWQGRRFKTKKYADYRMACMFQMPVFEQIEDHSIVVMAFFLRYPNRSDVDNFVKPMLDIVVKKGLLKDDRLVDLLLAVKIKTQMEERSVISILPTSATLDDMAQKVGEIRNQNS